MLVICDIGTPCNAAEKYLYLCAKKRVLFGQLTTAMSLNLFCMRCTMYPLQSTFRKTMYKSY